MPVAVLVHCVANKVDRSADFCPQMGNEQPQRAGKSDSQAKFATLEKNTLSYCRPTGRLDPTPADLAYGSIELAALEYQARRGEIILLYGDETIMWRFALPRAGWWRRAQRPRLPIRPLSQSHIKREETRKR